MPREHAQFCGIARSLDLLGDRWSLLVVRELLIGPARFKDLEANLFGVPTRTLTERLRRLEDHGVITRESRDHGRHAYLLTPWGEQLREVVEPLIRWSTPLMRTGRGEDDFSLTWFAVAIPALLATRRVEVDSVLLGLEIDGRVLEVAYGAGRWTARRLTQDDPRPDTVLVADAELTIGLAAGAVPVETALRVARLQGPAEPVLQAFAHPQESPALSAPAAGASHRSS